jgi:hypothetical protein
MQIFIYVSNVCGPDLSVEPAATVGAAIEHVSECSSGVVTVAGSATIATVMGAAAVSVAVESLLRTIVAAVVTTAVALVATRIVVVAIVGVAVVVAIVVGVVLAVVSVVVDIVVGIVLTVVVAVAVSIIIAVAPTIVVIVVVVVTTAIVGAKHGSHHILHLGSHGSLAGLQISFPALQSVSNFINWSGGRRLGRRRWLGTWREFGSLFVEKTLKHKVSNRGHVGLVGWLLMTGES